MSPLAVAALALVCLSATLTACVPMLVAGAVGETVLVATDRRSVGAQADDSVIELKIGDNVMSRYGDKVHVNATSYNGVVLLSGEVPSQDVLVSIGIVAKETPRVRAVHNELAVGPLTSLEQRTNDTFITGKVKTRFVEGSKFSPTHVKVVTERGIVYLMGIVSRAEGDAAGQLAASTAGVARVVKLFEYMS
jgi:osmotically-inducible protein OsmY